MTAAKTISILGFLIKTLHILWRLCSPLSGHYQEREFCWRWWQEQQSPGQRSQSRLASGLLAAPAGVWYCTEIQTRQFTFINTLPSKYLIIQFQWVYYGMLFNRMIDVHLFSVIYLCFKLFSFLMATWKLSPYGYEWQLNINTELEMFTNRAVTFSLCRK